MDHFLSDLKDLRAELVVEPYYARDTGKTEARTTRHNTIRTLLTGKFSSWPGGVLLLVVVAVAIAAMIAVWWFSGLRPSGPLSQGSMRAVPITSWNSGVRELAPSASFSPDAKMVAFSATKTGATEIWVKPTVGGDEIQVTKNGAYNQYPVWAPNGHDLAFFSSRGTNRGIWRAAFTGGEQAEILRSVDPTARPLLWTKDGKIYFQEGSELFAVDEKTGERSRVTDFASKGEKPRTIEISADGSTVAYSVKEGVTWKLKVQTLGSDSSDEIASFKNQIDNLAWRPDSESVIFSSSIDGAYQAFEASPDVNRSSCRTATVTSLFKMYPLMVRRSCTVQSTKRLTCGRSIPKIKKNRSLQMMLLPNTGPTFHRTGRALPFSL
jgi:hypothetical protein